MISIVKGAYATAIVKPCYCSKTMVDFALTMVLLQMLWLNFERVQIIFSFVSHHTLGGLKTQYISLKTLET